MSCCLVNCFSSILIWITFILVLKKVICVLTTGWCKSNTCLTGKTVLITGGNAGLGYQTALALAGRGARVIIADIANMDESKKRIIRRTGNANVSTKHLDLSSLDSVRKFAEEINAEEDRLDVLINNAGIGGVDEIKTTDGLQRQMAVNYFGHFLLTHLLADKLKKSAPSRIVFVSSNLCFFNNVTPDNINEVTKYNSYIQNTAFTYGNSKLCSLVASNYFARKLSQYKVTSNAVYPGIVRTDIYQAFSRDNAGIFKIIVDLYVKWFGKTPFEGAQTQINCAIAEELENTTGEYFVDCKRFFQPSKTKDGEFCRKIIEKSEKLVKLQPEERLK